jgi:hypothetical protein
MNALNTAATEAEERAAALRTQVRSGDKLAPWLLLVATVIAMSTAATRDVLAGITSHRNVARLRTNSQAGDQFVSWILVILAVIAIGLIVVAAVNGWFSGRIGQLGK